MIVTETPETDPPGLLDVDAAVRSVLGAMFRPHDGPTRPRLASEGDVFPGRLLSLRHAESLSPATHELRIAPGTVVTPLARDFLKKAGIGLRWVSRSEVGRVRDLGEWGFSVETGLRSGIVEAFRRALLGGTETWREIEGSLDSAASWVAEGGARGAMFLTPEASSAVYRACQKPGVRASAAEDAGGVSRAVQALGVNLLVVEPPGKSIASLTQMGATFRRAGGPVVPDWLRTDFSRGASP